MIDDFLNFKRFITIDIIKIIFILGVITIILAGVIIATFGGNLNYILGFLIITIGNLCWRITCEILTIPFRINQNIENLSNKKKKKEK